MSKIINRRLIVLVTSIAILLCAGYIVAKNLPTNDTYTSYNGNINEFNFRLNFNTHGINQIDTYKGVFTKDLVLDGTKTIDFKIPDNVKRDIYNLMAEIDIMAFPDNLKIDEKAMTPSCNYEMTVTIGSRTKTIKWYYAQYPQMRSNLPKNNANFLRMVEYIENYIYSTREYKNMPEANGGYALQDSSFCNACCRTETFRLNGKLKGQIPITHI